MSHRCVLFSFRRFTGRRGRLIPRPPFFRDARAAPLLSAVQMRKAWARADSKHLCPVCVCLCVCVCVCVCEQLSSNLAFRCVSESQMVLLFSCAKETARFPVSACQCEPSPRSGEETVSVFVCLLAHTSTHLSICLPVIVYLPFNSLSF